MEPCLCPWITTGSSGTRDGEGASSPDSQRMLSLVLPFGQRKEQWQEPQEKQNGPAGQARAGGAAGAAELDTGTPGRQGVRTQRGTDPERCRGTAGTAQPGSQHGRKGSSGFWLVPGVWDGEMGMGNGDGDKGMGKWEWGSWG